MSDAQRRAGRPGNGRENRYRDLPSMTAFVGGRATLLGNSEGGGLAHVAVTLGVNVGLQ